MSKFDYRSSIYLNRDRVSAFYSLIQRQFLLGRDLLIGFSAVVCAVFIVTFIYLSGLYR